MGGQRPGKVTEFESGWGQNGENRGKCVLTVCIVMDTK